ncbi:MAG: class IV adenylate cyclase [Vicinamibacterales bacterium]
MPTDRPVEREIKLRFGSADEARAAVIAAGGTPLLGRRLQEDALLDSPSEALGQRRCALRVRMEAGRSRLTFKGPLLPGPMKLREELETVIGDGPMLLRVLEELDFRVWFRYEKYREEFTFADVIIAIDETPIGVFVEVEGTEAGINAMATALGRTPSDYIVDSYRGLFLLHGRQFGVSGRDLVFQNTGE